MKFEFIAKSVVSYIEDDVCVVSFADSEDPDPKKYLILSQALFDTGDDDEDISIEYGKDGNSVTGGTISARLNSESFDMKTFPEIVGVEHFNIALEHELTNDQRSHLKMIFDKSRSLLNIG